MRTRDVLRWHLSVSDAVELATLALAGAVLVALDEAACAVERWIDRR